MTTFTVTGSGLSEVDTFWLVHSDGTEIEVLPVGETDSGFTFDAAPTDEHVGAWDLVGRNADGTEMTRLVAAVTVTPPPPDPVITSVSPAAQMGVSTLYTVVGTDLPDTITKAAVTANGNVAITAGSLTPTGFTFTMTLSYPADDMNHFEVQALDTAGTVLAAKMDALALPTTPAVFTVTPATAALNVSTAFSVTGWKMTNDGAYYCRVGVSGVGFDDDWTEETLAPTTLTFTGPLTHTGAQNLLINNNTSTVCRKDASITVT